MSNHINNSLKFVLDRAKIDLLCDFITSEIMPVGEVDYKLLLLGHGGTNLARYRKIKKFSNVKTLWIGYNLPFPWSLLRIIADLYGGIVEVVDKLALYKTMQPLYEESITSILFCKYELTNGLIANLKDVITRKLRDLAIFEITGTPLYLTLYDDVYDEGTLCIVEFYQDCPRFLIDKFEGFAADNRVAGIDLG
jgi:hypothetical protein